METPDLRWIKPIPKCPCGKTATGILMDRWNSSHGEHCTACANRRLKASQKERAREQAERDRLAS